MMMAVRAMHMAVADLFGRGVAHVGNGAGEDQRDSGQRMITINHHLILGDVGDRIESLIVVSALELGTHLDVLREKIARFDENPFRIVFAERIFRL
jgi:hypothetical protein